MEEQKTLEQIERQNRRILDFDAWKKERNRDFLATPFKEKTNDD